MDKRIFVLLCVAMFVSSCVTTKESPDSELQQAVVKRAGAPLFAGMSDFNHPITTSDPYAQRYFNQGMVLAFGFNHAESVRAFKAAQALDPECAMCFWGGISNWAEHQRHQ